MKKNVTVIGLLVSGMVLFAAIHFSSAAQAQSSTPAFSTSRFAMLSGPVTVIPELKGGEVRTENGIFKLDTYTGTTWMMEVKISDSGARTATWVPVAGK